MNKRNKVLQVIAIIICIIAMCGTSISYPVYEGSIDDEPVALGDAMGTIARETDADINIMPDKYNTGAKGDIKKVALDSQESGVLFASNGNKSCYILDFCHKNKNISGTITISDCDFSMYQLNMYNEMNVERDIHVIFSNCKFSKIITGKTKSNVTYEFNNCTIYSFGGSNSTFNNCQFGNTYMDGLVPYQEISVNDCFFTNQTSMITDVPNHIDGTQIYGSENIDVSNVSYKNCRFEVPPIKNAASAATVNACIMLQLEFSNANNITIKDCTVNGGGYSLYARAIGNWSFSDVSINNIQAGCARKQGIIYPDISSQVSITEVNNTDSLYIGSIWKENGNTHFSVTNDTDIERKLVIYSDKKTYEFIIPACPSGVNIDSNMTYNDFPFDLDIIIPDDCRYAVCFDETESETKQIRYQNWSSTNAYVRLNYNKLNNMLLQSANISAVIDEGLCGESINYTLTSDGTLTLSGSGVTTLYRSTEDIPWYENLSKIKKIVIKDGITTLSRGLFKNSINLKSVVLPNSLEIIDKEVFSGCICLIEITIPSTITLIDKYAFSKTIIQTINYSGDKDSFSKINIEIGNETINSDRIINNKKNEQPSEENKSEDGKTEKTPLLQEGICGENVKYTIDMMGVMRIEGRGKTYNYHSTKLPPWWNLRQFITEVIVSDGITVLGTGMFKECTNLVNVELPETLIVIDGTSFLSCKKLTELYIPCSVQRINKYAFGSKGVQIINYNGTIWEWKNIIIENHNEALSKCIIITK